MLHSSNFTAVLDACVLYPAQVRDYLLRLAQANLYRPKWSNEINEEWKRNLLKNRKDLTSKKLTYTILQMNTAFPDAVVENYEALIDSLVLPDPNDRHVLAAAIKCKAEVIVTSNIKDFPKKRLSRYNIEVQLPDIFISNIIDLNKEVALQVFIKQIEGLDNPPQTLIEGIEHIRNSGLTQTADLLWKLAFSK